MKYIKTFESYDDLNLPPVALDIFDIWNKIGFTSYYPESFPTDLDWEIGDEIDQPDDHVVTYAAGATDDLGLNWSTSIDIIDGGVGREVNYDYIELEYESILKIIEEYIIPEVKKLDPKAEFIRSEDYIKTIITWENFVSLFPKVEDDADKEGTRIRITFTSSNGKDQKIVHFKAIKGEDKPYLSS